MIDLFTEYMLVPTLLMGAMILIVIAKLKEQHDAKKEKDQ